MLRAHLLPAFGHGALEDVTAGDIERWLSGLGVSTRTKNKPLTVLHGILRRAQRFLVSLNADSFTC